MRTKEERSLSPSQAMFRNCMYCYFFNLFFSSFLFLLGITLISCYLCVYTLLLLYIYIYIFCVCFVVVFFFFFFK